MAEKKRGLGAKGLGINALINTEVQDLSPHAGDFPPVRLQRLHCLPIEEAESYQRLQEEYQLSQEKIAEKVGKSRSAITNSLRLLQLDARVRNFVTENKLTGGHARSLLPVSSSIAR